MSLVETFLEVEIGHEEDFLKIKETLTRIGVASVKDKKLYQSCHILHKQGKYYITHFKELFALDGKPTNYTDEDRARRDSIALLLEEWGLIKIVSQIDRKAQKSHVKVLPYREKSSWQLVAKYSIGKKK
jgi:hypothetical protein